MDKKESLRRLQNLYALYDHHFSGLESACRKGCALCCTANVTMTTLEGLAIMHHWLAHGQAPPLSLLRKAARHARFQPALTINHLAALCADDRDIPDESADPHAGPCPLLSDDVCTVYAVRPFGCRAMVSLTNCAHTGVADMPDFVLAANTLFAQFVEALDRRGRSGNLTDILLWLSVPAHLDAYENRRQVPPSGGLAANRPIPVLMIPPEYRQRIQPLLRALQQGSPTPLSP
jgi:hypothetical protein